MATQNQGSNQQQSSDEIDLRQLLAGIGNFFGNFFNGLIWFVISFKNATWRYKKMFFIILFPVLIISIGLKTKSDDFYQTSMIIKNTFTNNMLMTSAIAKLDFLSEDENKEELAKVLDIPLEMALKVKGFESAPLITRDDALSNVQLKALLEDIDEQYSPERMERLIIRFLQQDQNTYTVTMYVYDFEILEELQEAVVKYLKENSYVNKRIEIEKESLRLQEEKLEQDLKQLDSLKSLVFKYYASLSERKREGSNNVILSDENNTSALDIFTEGEALYNRKLNVSKRRYLEADFEVIDGFTAFRKPINPGYIKTVAYGFLIAIGVFYALILLLELNIFLNKFEKTHQN